MKKSIMKKLSLALSVCIFASAFSTSAFAGVYDAKTDTLYGDRENGCYDDELATAKHVYVDTFITRTGLDKLENNAKLESLNIQSMANFSERDKEILFPYLSRGNIALAATLMAYSDYYASFGNDGTHLYQRVVGELCPQIKYYRSCATVVSAAMNAAGVSSYGSAATAGLVDYYEDSPDWQCLGQLTEEELMQGDIIFIDRKSHTVEYETGVMEDPEFVEEEKHEYEYKGGYDSTGHKNYENQEPTGQVEEVFCPDQDGDGQVGEWEGEYWKCYWERANAGTELDGYVPPYEYYYVWKDEAEEKARKAEEAKRRREEEERQQREAASATTKRRVTGKRVIHDHIFVWTGNEVIRQVFPESTGNIISGSYTENYANARSAAVSKYNFTGDYRVYRYIGEYDNNVDPEMLAAWIENTEEEIVSENAVSRSGKYTEAMARAAEKKKQDDEIRYQVGNRIKITLSGVRTDMAAAYISSGLANMGEKRKWDLPYGGPRPTNEDKNGIIVNDSQIILDFKRVKNG